jgi:hypothetical protein
MAETRKRPEIVEVPEPAYQPPEPDVIVVDRVPQVMTNAELADAAHALIHELFTRLEPNFYRKVSRG